jgi:hypothetical protein
LKENYEELNIRHQVLLAIAMIFSDYEKISLLKAEIEIISTNIIQEKYQQISFKENLPETGDYGKQFAIKIKRSRNYETD